MMKKTIFRFAMAGTLMCAMAVTGACGDDAPEVEKPGKTDPTPDKPNPDQPNPPAEGDRVLTEGQQKAQLRSTAEELMNRFNASDFRNLSDLARWLDRNDWDEEQEVLGEWFDACIDACDISAGDNIARLWAASNFTGAFEVRNGCWTKTGSAGNLSFTFPNQNGQTVVAMLDTEGEVTEFHHKEMDEVDEWYDSRRGEYVVERKQNRLLVPEVVKVSLTQDGRTLAHATVRTKLDIAADGEFNLERDKAEITADVVVNNYQTKVTRLICNGRNIASQVSMIVNGETVATMEAEANGRIREEFEQCDGEVSFAVNLLGQVRAEGHVKDVQAFKAALEDTDEYVHNEDRFRRATNQLNQNTVAKLFFFDNKVESAYLGFEPLKRQSYRDDSWQLRVVVRFGDGTAYSPIDSYFSEKYFEGVRNQFEDLIKSFEDLADF